ncbi:UNVERIFIED_CONTAM: hypothetical protein K2H54_040890 [Gekko kuhli]
MAAAALHHEAQPGPAAETLTGPPKACNCNQYLKISKEKMMQLMKQRGFLTDAEEAAEQQQQMMRRRSLSLSICLVTSGQ